MKPARAADGYSGWQSGLSGFIIRFPGLSLPLDEIAVDAEVEYLAHDVQIRLEHDELRRFRAAKRGARVRPNSP